MFAQDKSSSKQYYTRYHFIAIVTYIFCCISSNLTAISFVNYIHIIGGVGSLSNYRTPKYEGNIVLCACIGESIEICRI